MTARELAEYFEVSVRTILRDLEALDEAGIPVVTTQGQGGGVGLMEGFTLDRQFLSVGELSSMFVALEGIAKFFDGPEYHQAKEKLTNLVPKGMLRELGDRQRIINIDIAAWGCSSTQTEYVNTLVQAAQYQRLVSFLYRNSSGESVERSVEPYQLFFRGSSWYLNGYCLLRGGVRFFRVSRMRDLELLRRTFTPRPEVHVRDFPDQRDPSSDVLFHLRFDSEVRFRVEDFFGEGGIHYNDDGSMDVEVSFPEDGWVYSFILSYGEYVEVLKPTHVRKIIQQKGEKIMEKNRRIEDS